MPRRLRRGGGEWIRTIEAEATDLQSAPFDHSGTPPDLILHTGDGIAPGKKKVELADGFEPPTC